MTVLFTEFTKVYAHGPKEFLMEKSYGGTKRLFSYTLFVML